MLAEKRVTSGGSRERIGRKQLGGERTTGGGKPSGGPVPAPKGPGTGALDTPQTDRTQAGVDSIRPPKGNKE